MFELNLPKYFISVSNANLVIPNFDSKISGHENIYRIEPSICSPVTIIAWAFFNVNRLPPTILSRNELKANNYQIHKGLWGQRSAILSLEYSCSRTRHGLHGLVLFCRKLLFYVGRHTFRIKLSKIKFMSLFPLRIWISGCACQYVTWRKRIRRVHIALLIMFDLLST